MSNITELKRQSQAITDLLNRPSDAKGECDECGKTRPLWSVASASGQGLSSCHACWTKKRTLLNSLIAIKTGED